MADAGALRGARRSRSRRAGRRGNLSFKNAAGYAFISPWLLGFFAFIIIPVITSGYYSFTDYDILKSPVFVGIQNFRSSGNWVYYETKEGR